MKTKNFFTTSRKSERDLGDYSKKEGTYYLIGMLGQNMIYAIITAALQLFYTDVLIIPTAAVGLVLGLARVWDAINDPIIGVVVDRTDTKWGKCRPYLKWMPIPVAIITFLLFLPMKTWGWSNAGMIAYLTIIYFAWSPIYTFCDIPLWSLPSVMVPDEKKRTKLLSYARIVGTIGGGVGVIYLFIKDVFGKIDMGIFPDTGKANYNGYFNEEQGFLITTFIICVIATILFKLIFPNTRERIKSSSKTLGIKDSSKIIKTNKPFLRIMLSSILGFSKLLILTAGLYFSKWVMGDGGDEATWLVILGAPFLVTQLLALGLTPKFCQKYGKKKLYIWSSYLSAIPLVLLFAVVIFFLNDIRNPWVLAYTLIMMAIYGFFSGFSVSLQPIMINDCVDYQEWKNGVRSDGVFFSGLTFVAKLTSALAALVSMLLLACVNYTNTVTKLSELIKNNKGYVLDFTAEYPAISIMLLVLITIIPAVGSILQAASMHKYELDDNFMNKVRSENEQRRKENELATETEENLEF